MRGIARLLFLPLAAGLLLTACEADEPGVAPEAEPAAENRQDAAPAGLIVTEDTQRVYRPDIPIVPSDAQPDE
jgi:hypothetical protein